MRPQLVRICSRYRPLGRLPRFSQAQISEEPPLHYFDLDSARRAGGPIMRAFIEVLPAHWLADPTLRLRIKLSWVRAGWQPCCLGWHLDCVEARDDGTLDLIEGRSIGAERIGCNVGDICPTRVLEGDVDLPNYGPGEPGDPLHVEHLETAIARGEARVVLPPEGELFLLDCSTFHDATIAARDGWRIFMDANRGGPWTREAAPNRLEVEVRNGYCPRTAREAALLGPYHPEYAL